MRVCTLKNDLFNALLMAALLAIATPAFAQDEAPKEGETTEKPAEAKGDEKPADGEKPADAEKKEESAESSEKKPADGEVPLGPGGKPLRTDYPGTEESKQARMDTDQIKGMNVDPNEPSTAYKLRITELETKIDDLKEKVFQSKTRIVLLRENLLSGTLTGARLKIIHKTELGSAWKLDQAIYSLDGERLYSKIDKDGDLSDKRTFEIIDRDVSPGTHRITNLLRYKGTSVGGLFPYFKGYDGDVKGACDVSVVQGKITQVTVSIYPKGGIGESIEQRPDFKCETQTFDYTSDLSGEDKEEPKE